MAVWSTRRAGDRSSVGHRMQGFLGQPSSPVCGISTEGLWFRRDHEWDDVPAAQRCLVCGREEGPRHDGRGPERRLSM